MKIALALDGTAEIPGPRHNDKIAGWLAKLGAWWRDDEAPWCGVFVAHCMQEAGLSFPKAYYRAKAWEAYGSLLRPDRLAQGAILIFQRDGGGHVGFYVGENATHYYVLGGNQSNKVCVSKIAKSRLSASRWPAGVPVAGGPRLITLAADETRNEA